MPIAIGANSTQLMKNTSSGLDLSGSCQLEGDTWTAKVLKHNILEWHIEAARFGEHIVETPSEAQYGILRSCGQPQTCLTSRFPQRHAGASHQSMEPDV